ncbi:hypothetical protein JCM5350_002914 [Sporobolomyces pararoseus]
MSESTARGRGRGRGGSRGRGSSSRGGAAGVQSSSGGIPSGSVSKIKAQLRQTKRLLSKPDLTPDVRVTSERRLQALEDELVKAEKGLLEKKMVTKYRGIKFFERQKVLRRIKQAKKQLEQEPGSDKVQEQLKLARIDLYYILRYPKTEKYLALYPENSYIPYTSTPPSTSTSSITPSDPSTSTKTSTNNANKKALENDVKRWKLRKEIFEKVESGEWNPESEGGDLGIEGEEDVGTSTTTLGDKRTRDEEEEEEAEEAEEAQGEVEQEDDTTPAKKRKVETAAVTEETEETVQEEVTKEGEGEGGEPKKLNRKQKKALRRAQEAAGITPVTPSATITTSTTANTKKAAAPSKGSEKGVDKKKETSSSSKAEKLAMEDDFFA